MTVAELDGSRWWFLTRDDLVAAARHLLTDGYALDPDDGELMEMDRYGDHWPVNRFEFPAELRDAVDAIAGYRIHDYTYRLGPDLPRPPMRQHVPTIQISGTRPQ